MEGVGGNNSRKNYSGRSVAVKTGMSIWNSRDFQNMIEDIDTVTHGGSIE